MILTRGTPCIFIYSNVLTDFWWKNLKERYRLENVGVEGMILKWVKKLGRDMNWIHLAQDRDNWRANYCVHPFETLDFIKCIEVFGLAKELLAFQGRVMYVYRFESRGLFPSFGV